jgi:hypothetical protein
VNSWGGGNDSGVEKVCCGVVGEQSLCPQPTALNTGTGWSGK